MHTHTCTDTHSKRAKRLVSGQPNQEGPHLSRFLSRKTHPPTGSHTPEHTGGTHGMRLQSWPRQRCTHHTGRPPRKQLLARERFFNENFMTNQETRGAKIGPHFETLC